MSTTGYCYFYGDPIIMRDSGYHDNRFWITCKITFIYLMEKINFKYSILHVINKVATKYTDPEVNTYYIECDEEALSQLIHKYCSLNKEDSIKDDWDLYGSEFGKVEKKLHAYDIWGEQVLFSRSEESDNLFYINCSDGFRNFLKITLTGYKEISIKDGDRFKNKENFKLIECDEEEIFTIIYRLTLANPAILAIKKMLNACEYRL